MKLNVTFYADAWEDYLRWPELDPAAQDKINLLIKDISRSPYRGIGKPEMLGGNLAGWASRRITGKHRLVYRVHQGNIEIAQCFGHYSDR